MNFKITNPVKGTVPYPTDGREYGANRPNREHKGIDIPVPSGTKIIAPADGTVVNAENLDEKPCGGFIKIKHEQDGTSFYTKYCHVMGIKVNKGDKVKTGQVIGLSGGGKNDPHRGSSTGPHLHFEIEDIAGNHYNPWPYLNKYKSSEIPDSQSGTSPSQDGTTTTTDQQDDFDFQKTLDAVKKMSSLFNIMK